MEVLGGRGFCNCRTGSARRTADTAEEVWVWLVALDASTVLSSRNRQGRGTNGEGMCKWWALAVDRNVDGGYTTLVTITGDITNEEHQLTS